MNPNNVFIINGNLTKAPILRETEKGKHYTFLNLAVDNGYGKDAKPDFLSVAVWGKQAENCVKYLVKGQNVSVSGSVATETTNPVTPTKVPAKKKAVAPKTNKEEAVKQDLELQKGIEKLESSQKAIRNKVRTAKILKKTEERIEAQKELDSINAALDKLRKQRKVLAVILKDEPDPTPEISVNPELSM